MTYVGISLDNRPTRVSGRQTACIEKTEISLALSGKTVVYEVLVQPLMEPSQWPTNARLCPICRN